MKTNSSMPNALGLLPPFNFQFKKSIFKSLWSLIGLLTVFLFTSSSYGQTFPIRINCGNSGSATYGGDTFDADQDFSGELAYSSTHVTNPQPFKSIRYTKTPTTGSHIMDYKIAVPNGDYEVTLHFLEIYFGVSGSGGVGSRVFDVSIEGQLLEDDLDILGEVGQNIVYRPTHTVTINDGELTIDFVASVGDPIISAIEIMEAPASNIDVTSVTLNPTSTTLELGGSAQQLTATVLPVDASNPNVTWSSSDTSVATVNSSGLVSAVALGNTTITVTTQDGGYTAQTTVDVTNVPNTGDAISISGYNSTSSVHGFRNMIEFVGQPHAAIVYNPGEANELMFGMNDNGNFYWGTGAGQNRSPQNYYSMFLNGNNGDLGIRGRLTSNEVKVKLGGWADYVFFNDYELPSLLEVEKHIQEKGHLINIPSAAEVEANGIELGEMNKLLLEKIEELTLYTIEQNESLSQQNKTLFDLEERIKLLEAKN